MNLQNESWTALKSFVLRIFNRVFSSNVALEDIDTVRLLARERMHLTENDVDSVKLLTSEELHLKESDIGTVKLVLTEGIRFGKGDVSSIKLLVKEGLPGRLHELLDMGEGAQLCYSQEGESLILDRFFDFRSEGYYVDVGAHHPKRFSNTYALYQRGWRGINIDPTPGVKEMFEALRPEDVSLSVAISNAEGTQDFYLFSEPALNTFSQSLAEEYQRAGCKLMEVRPVETKRLESVLDECRIDKPIDFMSIDVEDHELPVLQSNNWDKYRPRVLLVEILNFDLNHPEAFPVHNFIIDNGYVLFAKTYNTLFYKDEK